MLTFHLLSDEMIISAVILNFFFVIASQDQTSKIFEWCIFVTLKKLKFYCDAIIQILQLKV